jgi:hypothetical protein
MTEISTGAPPLRLLETISHCLGNPVSREPGTANEPHDRPEGFGGRQARKEESGHGRLERVSQVRPACDTPHLVAQFRGQEVKSAEVDPVTRRG